MILGLIGMSGIGKTAWASRLAEAGFASLHCDDLIAERLRARFTIASPSLEAVGAWMGMPYEPHYAERAAAYLAEEAAVLQAVAAEVAGRPPERGLVIDLTGSSVYVDSAILHAVRGVATLVYLVAAPGHQQALLREYLARPRPVIWNGQYQPLPGEPPEQAIARCYPHLLAEREALYAAFADVQIAPDAHLDPALTVEEFLRLVIVNRKS